MVKRMALVLMLAAVAGTAAAEPQTVWQIGKPDGSYMEFAIAGDYHAWDKQFAAKDPVFEVGKSDPAKDWPFIHPGPGDSWAGAREHPFTIRFTLADEPRGIFTLRIDLADTHGKETPRYVVRVGERTGDFRLPPGGGDASLTDPKAGKPYKLTLILPAEAFKKGANQIVLTCADASWVQYDAITLGQDPDAKMPEAAVQSVTATPTPFFVRGEGGTVARAVEVSVALTAPAAEVTIRAEAGGKTVEVPVKQLASFGGVSREVVVPDSNAPIEVKVTATAGASSKTTTVTVPPQRKWRIYVAASSHNDIGYTDTQARCAERHNQNTDLAAELAGKFPDFKWNLEVAWQAENYLASRKGEKLDAFLKLAKEGRIGVQALYCNILTGLCSTEEACRFTWFAHSLKDKYGIPYRSAMISDVPTQEATIPMLLAGAGIRYFSSGANNDRGYTFTKLYDKSPYWWEGPDGSRVLMTLVPGYSYADGWGLSGTVESARPRVMSALKGLEGRKDYPYDAVFLHGAVSDNCPMNPRLADVCKAWNERYEYPKLILCENAEFHEYIEKNYGDKLPVVKGSGGTYWEDGAGSSAQETKLVRNAHECVTAAQTLLALAKAVKGDVEYPAAAINETWRQCLLYDEHTWGAAGSIGDPEGQGTKAQWKVKAQFAVDAKRPAWELDKKAKKTVASMVKTEGPSVIVINPTGAARAEAVLVDPGERQMVPEKGIPMCQVGPRDLVLLVKDVPPFGWRTLRFAPANDPIPAKRPTEGSTIESPFYRVEFDPATGAAKSIFDKIDNRELLDTKAPYQANQYLYVSGGDGTRIVAGGPVEPKLTISTAEGVTLTRVRLGTLGEAMEIHAHAPQTPKLDSMVTVWNDVRRIDFINILDKTLTYKKEGVYFAFPFAAEKPVFRYEVPAGIVNANTEMLPGACYDWFTAQDFVEVESSPGGPAVAWSSPDAPLVCFQDIFRGKWQSPVPFKNGHLYAYVMNNYWHTNYKAGQDGKFIFKFALTSSSKSDMPASAAFGAGVASSLAAVPSAAAQDGPLTGPSGSLASVAEANVRLVSAKRAEKGGGLVLRLWEVAGTATTAHVKLPPMMKAAKATACNLVEEPLPQGAALEIKDGAVAVPVPARGLATVLVE
jgi:alpha-mannosidase